MIHRNNKPNRCWICLSNAGYLEVFDEKGNIIPGQLSASVSDTIDGPSVATITMQVNIVSTEQEMMNEIRKESK